MKLNDKIFRDLANIAKWYFGFSDAPEGILYSPKDVIKAANIGKIKIDDDKAIQSELPSCATWHDKNEKVLELNYNGEQIYRFKIGQIFDVLNSFRAIASVKPKEKEQLCQMIKVADIGDKELLLTVRLPKNKTKHVLRAADDSGLRPILQGLCVDKYGYIVASDGKVLNVCKADVDISPQLDTDILLPTDFARFADGKTVQVYKSSDNYIASCEDITIKLLPCKYPDWKSVFGQIVDEETKGKLKVNSSELMKACTKKLSIINCAIGNLSVLRRDDTSESEVILPKAKSECTCTIGLKGDVVSRVMPRCHTMYATESCRPIYFLGDGYGSLLMPVYLDDAPYFDFGKGEKYVDFLGLLDSKNNSDTKPDTKPKQQTKQQTKQQQNESNKADTKPTALQLVIIRHLYARRKDSSQTPSVTTMTEAINLIKQLRRQ